MIVNQNEIVKKFIDSCKQKFCFIQIPESLLTEEFKKSFVVIDAAVDFSPYKPFLTAIQISLDGQECDNKFIEKNSFYVQRQAFISFFEKDCCEPRLDIPLQNETVYEQNRFIQTIIKLLEKYSDKNFLILNSQCISSEASRLVRALEKSNIKSKFVFSYSSYKNELSTTASYQLLQEYSTKPNYLNIKSDLISLESDKTDYQIIMDMTPDQQYERIFTTLRNNRIFICLEPLKQFCEWVSNNLTSFDFDEHQKRRLNLELSICFFSCNMIDEAILHLNDIIDIKIEDEICAIAYYYLARAFSTKRTSSLLVKYFKQAVQLFAELQNDQYLALCAMLDFQHSKTTDSEYIVLKYQEALRQLENQGFLNNYILVSVSVPWKLMNDVKSKERLLAEIDKSLDMAQKIDNQHLVSTACHWKGIIFSHYGEMDEALKWYDKCNEIRTKIGEIGPLMNIRNGLCYDSICRAMYKRAYNLENDISEKLYNISDFTSVTDTLKNLCYTLFYSRHYKEAYELFNTIAHYLEIFNLEEISANTFLPSISDTLLFKTIIEIDSGDYIRGKINLLNLNQSIESLTREDYPFIFYIEAALYAEENRITEAEIAFSKCIEEFNNIKSKMTHKIIFAYYEFGVILIRLGHKQLSDKYMKAGFKIAHKEKFDYYTKKKNKPITAKEYVDGVEEFEPLKLNILYLNEKAEKEQLVSILHKRLHDYQFINKVKTSYIKDLKINKYIKSILLNIAEYTFADSILFCIPDEDGKFKTIDAVFQNNQIELTSKQWEKLFKSSKKSEIAQLVFKPEHHCYFGNLSYSDLKFGLVMIPSKAHPFNNDVVNIINIALTTIQSQLVIFKQEEHLMIMSTTDQLSHLNNRHAFQECIELESERIRRYMQRKGHKIQISIAFIDLDNFKYYNDNFGHNVGDLLIKQFSEVLRNTCRKIDFISRFGGDEFVIIMVDTNDSEGIRVFNRLNQELINQHFFIPKIKELLKDHYLKIPSEKHLGFSMGISTNFDIEHFDDLNTVVQNADKALYWSKEHCKGTVTIWKNIKEKV